MQEFSASGFPEYLDIIRKTIEDGQKAGVWVTTCNKTYDVAFTADHYGAHARFHHVTYALDSREDILRAADIFLEAGVHIETGPHKHAGQQTSFLHVYEPGGNSVEVTNAVALPSLAPEQQPAVWTETQPTKGQACGHRVVKALHARRDPAVQDPHRTPPAAS